MKRFIMTALFLCVAIQMPLSTKGAQDTPTGIDLFIEACRWQGLNPAMIRTGYAEFEMVVATPQKSEEEIRKEIEQRSTALREFIGKQTNEKIRSNLERALETLQQTVQARNTGTRKSRIKVLFSGNDSTFGKRRSEVINLESVAKKWDKPLITLRRGLTKEGEDNVLWNAGARTAVISKKPIDVIEFQAFGRMQGFVSKITVAALLNGTDSELFEFPPEAVAAFKKETKRIAKQNKADLYRLVKEVQYDGKSVAYIVESRIKTNIGYQPTQLYWIDASRGYICPLIQIFGANGKPRKEWKSSNYFLHEKSGLWFPEHHVFTEYDENTGKLHEKREYTLDRKTLQINQKVSDAELAVQIPSGASVLDTRNGQQVRYRATAPATLSLTKGGLDLASNPAFSIKKAPQPPKPVSQISTRMLLVITSFVLLGITLFLLWRRKKRVAA